MINVIKQAATEAGNVLLKYYKKNLTLNYKSSFKDFYTIADVESQKIIKETITKLLLEKGINESDLGFIGEENLSVGKNVKHLFIIDPLDGTVNFTSGLDFFTVSVAYLFENTLSAGIIYQPTSRTMYSAVIGKGAFLNNQPLKMTYKPLKQCLLSGLITSQAALYPRMFKLYLDLFPHITGYRNLNSMALDNCLAASNAFDIVINGHTFIWDIAAAKLIIEEAGGEMFDFNGLPINLDQNSPSLAYNVVSCHPKLKTELLKYFK